jgi:iron(II)-dependent oxidoreductase
MQKQQPADSQLILEARVRPQDLPRKFSPQAEGSDGAPMIFVPPGEFQMGSTPEDIAKVLDDFQGVSSKAFQGELPQHRVDLPGYYIDQFEVSVKLYGSFLKATDRPAPKFWGNERFLQPDLPVVGITWFDANEYCKWAGKRLPSEAEWEKAARGSTNNVYPWGMTWDYNYSNTASYWAKGKFSAVSDWAQWIETALENEKAGPIAIGQFPNGASPYGVYDMVGNAAEWVFDWYAPYEENSIKVDNPTGKESGTLKVYRGGSWSVSSVFARSSFRARENPEKESPYIGFRCAKAS